MEIFQDKNLQKEKKNLNWTLNTSNQKIKGKNSILIFLCFFLMYMIKNLIFNII
jgi:hypothetical protein